MSSFISLTLSPTPLVSFNIATPSRTLDAIAASQEFNIHILAGDATGVAIADRFTRGNGDDVASLIEEKASSLTGEDGQHSAPLIESQGILRVLRCRLLSDTAEGGLIQIRDHMIVVGEVLEVVSRREVKDFGLAYADRRYRRTGGVIEDQR
ncbi:Flavin reductase-like, FMN-binding protein [Moelleriella libera RCEF 2490]|uniref:Flavin reductase-like, FMN-binding protein n=1 Tax=Moelleriella libera RCEF 2490 TaxID=1081109 RepID=A0A167ZCD0_9HYPO|nr:Flavin reductase-like, FMN-binding protein [Moelleriella libera RCEF 2490]